LLAPDYYRLMNAAKATALMRFFGGFYHRNSAVVPASSMPGGTCEGAPW